LSSAEAWGTWSSSDAVTLEFSRPLPEYFNIHLIAHAFSTLVGKEFVAHVGDSTERFTLGASNEEKILKFDNPKRFQILRIDIPYAISPKDQGLSSDQRRLGIAFTELRVEPTGADHQSDTERLASHRISNYSDLREAAQDVGLRFSEQLRGWVDEIGRIDEREVNMAGWLADAQGNSAPLNLLVFIDGSMVAAAQTKGERPDVTTAVHLGFGAEKNVAFSLRFNCRPGDRPIIVGVGQRKQYIALQSKQCP
jgi:hypothetical protein